MSTTKPAGSMLQPAAAIAASQLADTLDFSGHTITLPAANTPVFVKSYTSTAQTITAAGTLTLAHGLGAAPKLIQLRIKCTSADQNYSINDELQISNGAQGTNLGISVVSDATNLVLRFGSDAAVLSVLNKTTGASAGIDPTKWQLIARAFA